MQMRFDNGYTLSIIDTGMGAHNGLLECAVLTPTRDHVCDNDPDIKALCPNDSVAGYMTADEALVLAKKIAGRTPRFGTRPVIGAELNQRHTSR